MITVTETSKAGRNDARDMRQERSLRVSML
jgi:hypothetical protein